MVVPPLALIPFPLQNKRGKAEQSGSALSVSANQDNSCTSLMVGIPPQLLPSGSPPSCRDQLERGRLKTRVPKTHLLLTCSVSTAATPHLLPLTAVLKHKNAVLPEANLEAEENECLN